MTLQLQDIKEQLMASAIAPRYLKRSHALVKHGCWVDDNVAQLKVPLTYLNSLQALYFNKIPKRLCHSTNQRLHDLLTKHHLINTPTTQNMSLFNQHTVTHSTY